MSTAAPTDQKRLAPTELWMHLAFILTGLGTLLLGPILPLLTRQWHLSDAQSGLLFSAQFYGSFLGGLTVSKHLSRSMIVGMFSASIGFGLFALSPSILLACIGLLIGGYGCGQLITSINILGGRRYAGHRGSRLAFLNFSFSFGMMLSPALTALLAPRFALRTLLTTFSGCFFVLLLALFLQLRGSANETTDAPELTAGRGLPTPVFLFFCALLILYGGLETCLGGWLTTFSVRYGSGSLALGESTLILLLIGLTAGRAASSLLLLRMGERLLLRLSLAFAATFTATLALAHSAATIAAFAVLLGLSLAPFFPATWSLLMARTPTARQAGVILAVSAIGAAAFPWLMGVVSARTGSLQLALALPFGAAMVLLALSLVPALTRGELPPVTGV